jgi:Leucine-rich repeat (LRR) protein
MATFITSKPVGQNITIYIQTSTGYWKYNHNGTDSMVFNQMDGQQVIPVTNANGEFTIISCDSNGTVSGNITYLGLQDYMGNNQITSFNGTGLSMVTTINLAGNQLTSFNGTGLTSLINLGLGGNQLTSLDVSSLTSLTSLQLVDMMFGGTNPMTPEANNSILNQLDENGLSMGNFHTTGGRTSAGTADYNSLIGKMWNIQGADLPLPVTFITSKPVGQNITIYITTSTGYWKYKHNGVDSSVFNSMNGQQVIPVTNSNGEFTIIPCDSNGTRSGNITYLGLQDFMGNNQITSFNGTGLTSLTHLNLNNNQLTSLDVSSLTSLTILTLGGNQLTSLDVSSLTGLTTLWLVDIMWGGTNPITPEANNSILAQLDENGLSMGNFATTGGRTSAGTADYNSLIGKMWTIQGADLPLTTTFITAKPVGQNITIYPTTSTGYWKYKHNGVDSMVFNQMNGQQVIPVTNSNGEFTIISCDPNGTRSGNITYLGLQDFMGNNQITSFNGTGLTSLTHLNLVNNQLTSFNGTGLTSLQYLQLGGNQLTSLDVSSLTSLTSLQLVDMMFGGTNPMTPEANNSILAQLDENGLSMGQFYTTGGRTSAGTADYNSLIGKMWALSGLDLMETTTTTTTAAPSGNGKLRIKGVTQINP